MTKKPIERAATRSEPDLVDQTLGLVLIWQPELKDNPARLAAIESNLRQHFGGARAYVRKSSESAGDKAAAAIMSMRGQSATTISRKVGISRSTVYNVFKRPAKAKAV
ncbi:MAG: helix-turn-helix domain-containing protein [Burkholderiaceae bacterium]